MSVFTNPASGSKAHAAAYVTAVLDLLGAADPVQVLDSTPLAFAETLDGLSVEALARPEEPGKWSMGQVLQHMADSELVWGYRVRMILSHDRPQISGYDQDAWATRLHYERADARQALEDFSVLRRANLRLVQAMTPDDYRRVGIHAERGEEGLAHMVRLYAGHDLLHRRQLERIRAVVADPRDGS
ncbi:MAG TPA: DinB family protein [Vicinamibacterales bacterium]|nr:DinB family protein [Vicinamibacterales bacterium]